MHGLLSGSKQEFPMGNFRYLPPGKPCVVVVVVVCLLMLLCVFVSMRACMRVCVCVK